MWHQRCVKPKIRYGVEAAYQKELQNRMAPTNNSNILEQIVSSASSYEKKQSKVAQYDPTTMIDIVEEKHESFEYARWMNFIRKQEAPKRKLPNGPNRKWIAWQRKKKEIEASKAAYDPFAKSKRKSLLQQSMGMLALSEAKEASEKVDELNNQIAERVEKLTARGEEVKEQYTVMPSLTIDSQDQPVERSSTKNDN